MNHAIEISLCVLAWLIALNRGRTALLNRAWRNDPTAFLIGAASLFFALTMTFLVTPLSDIVNRLTMPNFSRLLAYSFVSVTLYLTTSSSLITVCPSSTLGTPWIFCASAISTFLLSSSPVQSMNSRQSIASSKALPIIYSKIAWRAWDLRCAPRWKARNFATNNSPH